LEKERGVPLRGELKKGMKNKIAVAASALALCAAGGEAYAGSITQPGELIGYALGAPLPEGLYFATTASDGNFRGVSENTNLFVNIPVVAWSTPWMFLGGRVEAYFAAPVAIYDIPGAPPGNGTHFAVYNPFFTVGDAWDLGNKVGFSTFVGAYGPVENELNQNNWTFNSRSALSYTGNDWNLTAHVVVGLTGDDENTGRKVNPDYVNLDLTAVKTFNKVSIGPVAFGSWDISNATKTDLVTDNGYIIHRRQAQFAVGGWIGYDFTVFDKTWSVGFYGTTDVWSQNYFNQDGSKSYEQRGWMRLVVPLWTPPKEEKVTYKH
jgi:hypothetical protein